MDGIGDAQSHQDNRHEAGQDGELHPIHTRPSRQPNNRDSHNKQGIDQDRTVTKSNEQQAEKPTIPTVVPQDIVDSFTKLANQDKSDEPEFKTCPFCESLHLEDRSSGIPDEDSQIECMTCGACGPVKETYEEAVAAWNRRAESEELLRLRAKVETQQDCFTQTTMALNQEISKLEAMAGIYRTTAKNISDHTGIDLASMAVAKGNLDCTKCNDTDLKAEIARLKDEIEDLTAQHDRDWLVHKQQTDCYELQTEEVSKLKTMCNELFVDKLSLEETCKLVIKSKEQPVAMYGIAIYLDRIKDRLNASGVDTADLGIVRNEIVRLQEKIAETEGLAKSQKSQIGSHLADILRLGEEGKQSRDEVKHLKFENERLEAVVKAGEIEEEANDESWAQDYETEIAGLKTSNTEKDEELIKHKEVTSRVRELLNSVNAKNENDLGAALWNGNLIRSKLGKCLEPVEVGVEEANDEEV